MRKNYIALALASSLLVAGCSTNPNTGLPTIDPTTLTTIETQVQQDAAAVCGFVPTIGTIASIVASIIPGGSAVVQIASSVAQQICTAVAPVKASMMAVGTRRLTPRTFGGAAALPTVNGVPIQGYFIK